MSASRPDLTGLVERISDRASELDRAWFAANPNRRHRIRALITGEVPQTEDAPPGFETFVAVWEIEPGARCRVPFCAARRPEDTERSAELVFMAVSAGTPAETDFR